MSTTLCPPESDLDPPNLRGTCLVWHSHARSPVSQSGILCNYSAGYHFLFAFNSFHTALSVWVTAGRTFQGLSPCFLGKLSGSDWDPLTLQEEGCSQVARCCLPVPKVLCVCRATEKRGKKEEGGGGGARLCGGSSWTSPSLRLEDFTPFHLKKWKCHGSVHLPNSWNLGQWFI